jgi:cleavage and polyadenylation specificity factor subunit 5
MAVSPPSIGRIDFPYALDLSVWEPQNILRTTNKMSTITSTALQTSYPPVLPKSFNGNQPNTIRLYPLSNYTFGTKETQPEEDPSVLARLKRLEEHYVAHGMRRTCEGILVCHEHNHPHILMLQIANAFFKLPGDYLHAEDDEIEGFKMRLNERLAPVGTQFSGEGVNEEWEIGDTLAQWWRPNFETFMYPFIPAHVTRPKECKKLYFIQLPRRSKLLSDYIEPKLITSAEVLSVPKNMKLLAVPLFELYDNTARYGPQLSAIPHLLSRYNFEFVDENGQVVAVTPGGGPDGDYVPKTKVLAGGDEEMKEDGIKEENGIQ